MMKKIIGRKRRIGIWLAVAGCLHIFSAIAVYYRVFKLIGEREIFNVVPDAPVIGAFVWSLLFGKAFRAARAKLLIGGEIIRRYYDFPAHN